jgi:hypothetical protein
MAKTISADAQVLSTTEPGTPLKITGSRKWRKRKSTVISNVKILRSETQSKVTKRLVTASTRTLPFSMKRFNSASRLM